MFQMMTTEVQKAVHTIRFQYDFPDLIIVQQADPISCQCPTLPFCRTHNAQCNFDVSEVGGRENKRRYLRVKLESDTGRLWGGGDGRVLALSTEPSSSERELYIMAR